MLIVLRTLLYQFLLIFIGIAVGFIFNAEWIGYKGPIIIQSIENIFFPVRFDEEVLNNIKKFGQMRLWDLNNRPKDFHVIEDGLLAEEWYYAKFSYTDENHKKQTKIESTRIRWKPWEYYYDSEHIPTNEEIKDYIDNGTLNSKESDKALKLRNELRKIN